MAPGKRRLLMTSLARALLYGVVSALCVLLLAITLSGPSQRERRQTAENVERLVEESQLNRELLCRIVFNDPDSVAWRNRRVTEICMGVGVRP